MQDPDATAGAKTGNNHENYLVVLAIICLLALLARAEKNKKIFH